MENGSPQGSEWSASGVLGEFCALGGAVRNIGPGRRGLRALDPTEAVLLRVPRNLLFRVADIEFVDDRLRIRESADIPEAERRFFENYQAVCGWGGEGRAAARSFIAALDELPLDVREILDAEFGLGDLLQGDFSERVRIHFVRSREILWHGEPVIAPLLELADRGADGLRYERGLHLQIQGYVRDEIRVRYGTEDAWSAFCRFGVAEPQAAAFSLFASMRSPQGEIVIRRNTNEGARRGEHRVPQATVDGQTVTLSYLLLGQRKAPRLPRGVFGTLLGEAGAKIPAEAFDNILRYNALKFIGLLSMLESHEGEMITTLRKVARYQLEAMNWCIGSRPLPPAAAAVGEEQAL